MGARAAAGATGSLTVAVAAILFAAPGLAASANATSVAPYSGTVAAHGVYLGNYCGSYTLHGMSWAAKTGIANGQASAKSQKCPASTGNYPDTDTELFEQISFPMKVTSSALYNDSLTFKYKLTSAVSDKISHCPTAINYSGGYDDVYCNAESEVSLGIQLEIYNVSGSSWMSPGYAYWYAYNYTEVYQDNDCNYGTCATYAGSYQCFGNPYTYEIQGLFINDQCFSAGTSSGSGKLWIDTSDYSASYNPGGFNLTLDPVYHYALFATIYLSSSTFGDYYGYSYNGANSYATQYAFPGGASANLNALSSSGGDGITITSVSDVIGH